MKYDAIIFDNDGVLTEPTDPGVLQDATRETFAAFDVTEPADEHVASMMRGVTVDQLERVCDWYGLDPAAFWERRDVDSTRAQQDEIRADRKSLYADTEAVWSLQCSRGIVSSNQHTTIECIINHFDLEERIGTYYGRQPTIEHIKRKKPDPYFIDQAMRDLRTNDVLYVGDSECDVTAAANADVDSAFVRRSHRCDTTLSIEPTYDIDDLWELERIVQ